MLKIPRIGLFRPVEQERKGVRELFNHRECALREIDTAAEARELCLEEGDRFDVLIVPLQLPANRSGISVCLEIKADELLASTPILGLSHSHDLPILQAFYGAGADNVLFAPFNADLLFLQVGALSRLKRNFDEKLAQGFKETGLYHPVVEAFQSVREGLLLFDTNYQLIFTNSSAATLLGIRSHDRVEDTQRISEQFRPWLKEHRSIVQSRPPEERGPSIFETSLNRIDQQQFKVSISISSIERERVLVGFSAALTDLSEIHHLSNTLLQAQRTRSLCLITAAACMRFLPQNQQSATITPLQFLEHFLRQAPRSCPLYSTLTSLLEALDLVVNPDINIRIKVEKDHTIAVRAPDLFQIIGHMLLHAVEHAGHSGEVSLHTSPHIPGEGVIVTITSESRKVTPFPEQDRISRLIHGDFQGLVSLQDVSDKLGLGLLAAQKVAERYRTNVEYMQPTATIMKIRIKLPVGQQIVEE